MDIIKIKKTPIIPDYSYDITDYEYPKCIVDFIDRMKNRNLSKFYYNLEDLELKVGTEKEFVNKNAGAEYDLFTNIILYKKDRLEENIMHELIHVSTRLELRDRILVGFLQLFDSGYGIGEGLNEGYTALQDDRYFLDYAPDKAFQQNNIYPTLKYICNILEYLVTKDQMEDYFYDANLYGLFKELSQYSSYRKTYNFLMNTDYLFKLTDKQALNNIKAIMITYPRVFYYLSECFLTRFKIMREKGELSNEDYNNNIQFVKWLLNNEIIVSRYRSPKLGIYFNDLDKIANDNLKSRVK